MNVLYVSRTFSPVIGGTEVMVGRLARHALSQGHGAKVLTSLKPPAFEPRAAARLGERSMENGIEVQRFDFLPAAFVDAPPGWRRDLSEKAYLAGLEVLAGTVRGLFGGAAPDVVHCHGINDDTFYLCGLTSRLELPLVVTAHGPTDVGLDLEFGRAHRYRETVTRDALRRASWVTAVSRRLSERIEAILPGTRQKLSTIPNGVDLSSGLPRSGERSADLLFAGRLSAEKGPDLLLDAFAAVAPRHPDVRLRIAGCGPLAGSLKEMAASRGIANRVDLLGALGSDEAIEEIRRACAVVVPSRQEACPLVVLEAISSATPLIVSDLAEIRAIVAPGTECVAFRAGDAGSLVEALGMVLTEREAAEERAHRALERARKNFDIYAVSESYFAIYEAVRKR